MKSLGNISLMLTDLTRLLTGGKPPLRTPTPTRVETKSLVRTNLSVGGRTLKVRIPATSSAKTTSTRVSATGTRLSAAPRLLAPSRDLHKAIRAAIAPAEGVGYRIEKQELGSSQSQPGAGHQPQHFDGKADR